MSAQEYELIQNEDEHCLKRYRKQCMQDMHERLSFGPRFEAVHELESGEAFLEVIEKEHRLALVVVHIYEHGVKGWALLNQISLAHSVVQTTRLLSGVDGALSFSFARL